MRNKTDINKSIRFLSKPYTILALFLYACNEFILQRSFPSWISGKLSDFAWLFIAPVILTLLLSLVFPSQRTRLNAIPLLAYGVTALFFIGIKTIPAFNGFILQSWLAVFHYPAAVAMDATDLLALLVLPLSWALWLDKEPKSNKQIVQTAIIISFFTLLTLADAPMYDAGIYDLDTYNNQLIAESHRDKYCSEDGGLSWKRCDFSDEDMEILLHKHTTSVRQINIPDSTTTYRINEKNLIQKSVDDGQTWEYVYFEDDPSGVEIYYLENHHPYGYCEGDMLFDPQSGNVLVAMGHSGMILINNNNFLQIGIEDYVPVERETDSLYDILVTPFIYPSVIIIIILFSIHTLGYKSVWYWFAIVFSYGIWLYSLNSYWIIMNNPNQTTGSTIFSILIILLFGLIIFSIISFKKLIKAQKTRWYIPILGSLPAGPLFYLTYALWFKEIIPSHNWALAISHGVIVLFVIYAIYRSYQLSKAFEDAHE